MLVKAGFNTWKGWFQYLAKAALNKKAWSQCKTKFSIASKDWFKYPTGQV
jgi:hypothetical protein